MGLKWNIWASQHHPMFQSTALWWINVLEMLIQNFLYASQHCPKFHLEAFYPTLCKREMFFPLFSTFIYTGCLKPQRLRLWIASVQHWRKILFSDGQHVQHGVLVSLWYSQSYTVIFPVAANNLSSVQWSFLEFSNFSDLEEANLYKSKMPKGGGRLGSRNISSGSPISSRFSIVSDLFQVHVCKTAA